MTDIEQTIQRVKELADGWKVEKFHLQSGKDALGDFVALMADDTKLAVVVHSSGELNFVAESANSILLIISEVERLKAENKRLYIRSANQVLELSKAQQANTELLSALKPLIERRKIGDYDEVETETQLIEIEKIYTKHSTEEG